jgi:pimeloyl-ACP methyl ester carboxylesterase
MANKTNRILRRTGNTSILLDYYFSEVHSHQPLAIFCHGYKGFKDWGAWSIMANHLADQGICVVKFNFSHNGGTVDNPIDFPDLEAFGHNNYTKELDDLGDVINWCFSHFENHPHVNPKELTLIGHSRGGGIVVLKAAEDFRVQKIITLAGVSDFESRFGSPEEIQQWQKEGVKYIVNGRTKQKMPHYYQFFEDFQTNKDRLCIKSAIQKLDIPHLIIHGDQDTSVKIDEASAMHQWNPSSTLKIIPNADHVFNIRHPWTKKELTPEFQIVITDMDDFIRKKAS